MMKRLVGCGGGRLKVREGGVLGEYCVNEREGRGEGRSEADGETCCCFAGRFSVKRVYFR